MIVMTSLIFAAAVVPAGTSFSCTPVRIWDADGPVWCAEGPKLRLSGIAAREMDGSCRPGQPCPDMPAEQARQILGRLLTRGKVRTDRNNHLLLRGAPAMACLSEGSAKGERTAARCTLESGEDLGCKLIATGAVVEWRSYSRGRYSICGR